MKIPLTLQRGLLYVPNRTPSDEVLLKWPIVDITSDEPWDTKALDNDDIICNHFRADSARSNKVTKLDKILGTEKQIDLKSLINAVHRACQLETHYPEFTDAEIEKLHSFLSWKPMEVIRNKLENSTWLTILETRITMR